MHCSLPPITACCRFTPPRAPQPVPGARLLHGCVASRKYAHRVRCMTLPPIVAMLRSCGDALSSSACATTGNSRATAGWSATSLMRASAPIRTPLAPGSIARSGSCVMSTSSEGRSTYSFIRSMTFVPPATYFAFRSAATVAIADATSWACA
jgi:hypothetical protein